MGLIFIMCFQTGETMMQQKTTGKSEPESLFLNESFLTPLEQNYHKTVCSLLIVVKWAENVWNEYSWSWLAAVEPDGVVKFKQHILPWLTLCGLIPKIRLILIRDNLSDFIVFVNCWTECPVYLSRESSQGHLIPWKIVKVDLYFIKSEKTQFLFIQTDKTNYNILQTLVFCQHFGSYFDLIFTRYYF